MDLNEKLRLKAVILFIILILLLVSSSSCKTSEKGDETAAVTYKTKWQKLVKARISSIYFSQEGKKILVTSFEEGKVFLLENSKELFSRTFEGLQVAGASLNRDASKVLLSLEKRPNNKGEASIEGKEVILLNEDGRTLWQKKLPSNSGFYEPHLSPDSKKIYIFYYPFDQEPTKENHPLFLILDSQGKKLVKEDFSDVMLASANLSQDFSKLLTGVTFPQKNPQQPPKGQMIGYENGGEVFRSPLQKGRSIAKFFSDSQQYVLGSGLSGKLCLYKWKETKAEWTQRTESISNLQVSEQNNRVLVESYAASQNQRGSISISEARLFSDKGQGLWRHKEESSVFYQATISFDGKKIALIPSKASEPAFLFNNLAKGALPQKLPENTIAAAFSPKENQLAIATASGYLQLLEIK